MMIRRVQFSFAIICASIFMVDSLGEAKSSDTYLETQNCNASRQSEIHGVKNKSMSEASSEEAVLDNHSRTVDEVLSPDARRKRSVSLQPDEAMLFKKTAKRISKLVVQAIKSKMDSLNMKITARLVDKIGKVKYILPNGQEFATSEALQIGTSIASGQSVATTVTGKKTSRALAVAFFAFEVLKMGLEFGDAGGYTKMGTLQKYMELQRKVDDFLKETLRDNGAIYPSVVGPLDKLPADQFKEKIRKVISSIMKPEAKDPLTEVMFSKLQQDIKDKKIQVSDIDNSKLKQYLFYVDIDLLLQKAVKLICKQQGGKVVQIGDKGFRCTFKDKQTCESSYSWPLSKGELYAEFKTNSFGGICSLASYSLRVICNANDLGYDTDTGLCNINETYCKTKGADWGFNENIGQDDCMIYKVQDVFETIFGKNIVRGLKQIFDPKQYKPCHSNETDDGYFCRHVSCPKGEEQWQNAGICYKKCRDGFHSVACCVCSPDCGKGYIDDGAFCRKADSCPSGKEHQGGLCYKMCRDGFKGVGPVCYQNCESGYQDKGVFCLRSGDVYAKKSRPASKKPCPKGLRDDGISCWKDAYGRGVGRTPDKTKCPPNHRDDGTSCWLDSYGRGSGRTPDKAPCPSGLRDDGTSCWSDAHIYGKGCCCTLFTKWCCGNCKSGYNDDGCTCRKIDVGIKVSLFDRQRCRTNEERNGALCYPKCKSGYHAVGCCICQPNEGPGIKVTLAQRQTCRANEEKNGALCYPKCKKGYHSTGCCLCSPNDGAGIKITLGQRQFCKDNEVNVAGICYEKCKEGYMDDGVFCRDSYTKKSYGRGVGTPATKIKPKPKTSYGRGVGTPAVHIRAKERAVPFSTKKN